MARKKLPKLGFSETGASTDAVARLHAFMEDMHLWELRTAARFAEAKVSEIEDDPELAEAAERKSLAELAEIFQAHCTPPNPRRGCEYEEPPEYDQRKETVVKAEVSVGRATITTIKTMNDFVDSYVYELKAVSGGWRVATKKWVSPSGDLVEHGL